LLSQWSEADPPKPGDIVAYRCADCLDRWDVEVAADTETGLD
jgi:hypothetical protein